MLPTLCMETRGQSCILLAGKSSTYIGVAFAHDLQILTCSVLATTSIIAQLYYLWANIEVLNKLRQTKGLNTFAFRPHAGETGDSMHLAATYMLCRSINHGINLDKQVSLQYLYYLDQVGLSVR